MNFDSRTLIIDDDSSIRDVIRQYLGIFHHEVYVAPDLITARELITRYCFNLIILDKTLPDGSGLSLLSEIRVRQYEAAVIVLTGDSDFNGVGRALAAGADDYLIKTEQLIPNLLVRFPVAVKHAKDRIKIEQLERRMNVLAPQSLEEVSDSNYQNFQICAEREYLSTTITLCNGDVATAAERIGVSRSTLFRKMTELGIPRRPWIRKAPYQNTWSERL